MRALGAVVLALVFASELAALAAYAVWGWAHSPRLLLVWVLPLAGATAWGLLAAPRARYAGRAPRWVRPVVKLVFFGLAVIALNDAGHAGWGLTLLVVAAGAHALAALPAVSSLTDGSR